MPATKVAPANAESGAIDPADRVIGQLYRAAASTTPGSFRYWALARVRSTIPFDGALWGTGAITSKRFHTCTVTGLPRDFQTVLEETLPINPLFRPILAQLDTPVARSDILDDEAWFSSDIYRHCFSHFGISHLLSTAHIDPDSGVHSLVTLYRRDRNQVFTPAERSRQGRLAYHLVNAASHAFFRHLNRTYGRRRQDSAAAVIDRQGLFHEAQPSFFSLLDQHFPTRAPRSLPFELPPAGESLTAGALCVATETISSELRCVRIWPVGPLDQLTARERDVVYAVAHGLSFKQAARKLDIAPSTVANHLYRVYRKLSLNSRTDLARLVYPDGTDEPTH